MENFKTVSIREKNYKFIDDFAYTHHIHIISVRRKH